MKVEIYNRPAVAAEVPNNGSDFVEITQWTNGGGVDITINGKLGNRNISLTYEEYYVIKELIKNLTPNDNDYSS